MRARRFATGVLLRTALGPGGESADDHLLLGTHVVVRHSVAAYGGD
ncbi:hypothetical protein ACWCY6_43730 [Streptomyces sp. 900105755]